jgi:hypothetical protein
MLAHRRARSPRIKARNAPDRKAVAPMGIGIAYEARKIDLIVIGGFQEPEFAGSVDGLHGRGG